MKERNYGIDILKILSMFLVVQLHVIEYGGLLWGSTVGTPQYYLLWMLAGFSYICIPCFGMISGYLGYGKNVHYSSLLERWFQVVYYAFTTSLVFFLFHKLNAGIGDVLHSFTPLYSNHYWYFTIYFGMFLILPLLNHCLDHLSERQGKLLFVGLFCLFSLYPTIAKYDMFALSSGYSVAWLSCLYLFGACIKKYDVLKHVKVIPSIVLILLLSIINGYSGALYYYAEVKPMNLLTYTSPTVLLISFLVFGLCLKIHVPDRWKKRVSAVSALSFGVYLFNDNYWLRTAFLLYKLEFLLYSNVLVVFLGVIAVCLGIYVLGTFYDWIRSKIFKVLRIRDVSQFLYNGLNTYVLTPVIGWLFH